MVVIYILRLLWLELETQRGQQFLPCDVQASPGGHRLGCHTLKACSCTCRSVLVRAEGPARLTARCRTQSSARSGCDGDQGERSRRQPCPLLSGPAPKSCSVTSGWSQALVLIQGDPTDQWRSRHGGRRVRGGGTGAGVAVGSATELRAGVRTSSLAVCSGPGPGSQDGTHGGFCLKA